MEAICLLVRPENTNLSLWRLDSIPDAMFKAFQTSDSPAT